MRSTKLTAVFVALVLCAAGSVAALPTDDSRTRQPQQAQQEVTNPNATLVFADQTSNGSAVRVNTATLSQGGFVTIHDTSLTANNSTVGSVVGVSQPLSAGPHQDVVVELYSVTGREFDESRLADNGTLIAMAHFDSNDNGAFDFVATNASADGPYVEGLQAVTDSATISVRPGTDDTTGGGILGSVSPVVVGAALVVVVMLVGGGVVAYRRRRDGGTE